MEIESVELVHERHGGYLWGLVGSVVGAAVGAAAWAIIAMLSQYELAIIAWALGGLAGFGMAWGHHRGRIVAGIIAALIALLGILAARAVLISYFHREELALGAKWAFVFQQPVDRFDKALRLGANDASEQARRDRRCPYDDQYRKELYEASARWAKLPDAELNAAYDELRQWTRSDRFEDQAWISTALPSYLVTEDRPEIWAKYTAIPPEEWDASYQDAQARAAALSAEERAATCRRTVQCAGVAWQNTRCRMMEEHRAFEDAERRLELYKQAHAETLNLSDEELAERYLVAEGWEDEGQWQDPAFLRLRLAYIYAEQAWREREQVSSLEFPAPGPSWDTCIEEAEQRVAEVPEASLADTVRREHRDTEHAPRQFEAQVMQKMLPLAPVVGAFTTFEPIDLLFGGLAVVTAYGVATKRSRLEHATDTTDIP